MPKIKTHKSTSKRFRLTGSGKVKRTRLGKSHLRRRKSKRVLRQLDEMQEVKLASQARRIRSLAPYLDQK